MFAAFAIVAAVMLTTPFGYRVLRHIYHCPGCGNSLHCVPYTNSQMVATRSKLDAQVRVFRPSVLSRTLRLMNGLQQSPCWMADTHRNLVRDILPSGKSTTLECLSAGSTTRL